MYDVWLGGHRLEAAMVIVTIAWAITMGIVYWYYCHRKSCLFNEASQKAAYWSGGYLVTIVLLTIFSLITHLVGA